MAYLGNGPLLGAYTHVDDISSGFNGTDVTFNLTKNSVAKYPVRAENILVSIDGVFQEPYESYDVLSNTITFTEAPVSGSSFFGIILGNVLNIGASPDGVVTADKMGTDAIDTAQIIDDAVTSAKIAAGAVDTTAIADSNVTTAKIADSNVTTAKIADSAITQAKLDLSSNLSFADSEKAIFGAGNDLQIFHNGSASYITEQGTGNLVLQAADAVILQNAAGTENMLTAYQNGSVSLYNNNNIKIATNSSGVDVTGTVYSDELEVNTSSTQTSTSIIYENDGVGMGPIVRLYRNKTAAADNDYLAALDYKGNDDAGNEFFYARINGKIIDASDGTEEGRLEFRVGSAGVNSWQNATIVAHMNGNGLDVKGEMLAESYNENFAEITSSSGTANFDCETANSFKINLTEDVTTTNFQNPPATGTAYTMSIELIQDASASGYQMAWPASVDWPGGSAPTPSSDASAKDIFVFMTRDGGTTWYGFTAAQALG